MAYATVSDLATRVGSTRLDNLSSTEDGTADSTLQQRWVTEAQSTVDSYLARRTAVPVSTTNQNVIDLLLKLTLDIAEYSALTHKRQVNAEGKAKYDNAMKWLELFAKGDVDLPGAVPPADPTTREYYADFSGDTRVMTRDNLSGF